MHHLKKNSWILVIPLILLAATLAIPRLNSDLFWFDEVLSIQMSGGSHYGPISFLEVIARTGGDRWPPLHNLAIIGWATLFGWSEFSIRLFSLYIGMIALAVMYRFGRDLTSNSTGLVATFLLATSAFFNNYLHEARGYTLVVLFTTLSLWLYFRLLTRGGKRSLHILFILSLLGQIYTHYVTATIIIALASYHLFVSKKTKGWNKITRDFFYALLGFSPWIPITYITISSESRFSRGKSVTVVLQELLSNFGNSFSIYFFILILLSLLFIRKREVLFGWFVLIVALVSALIVNSIADFLFNSRHILILMPVLYVLIAIGLLNLIKFQTTIIRSLLLIILLGIWALAGLISYQSPTFIVINTIARAPLMQMSSIMNACATPNAPVVIYIADPPISNVTFDFYFSESTHPLTQVQLMNDITHEESLEEDYESQVAQFIENAEQTWFFHYATLPETEYINRFENTLVQNYAYCGQIIENDLTVNYVYSQQEMLTCEEPYQQTLQLEPCE